MKKLKNNYNFGLHQILILFQLSLCLKKGLQTSMILKINYPENREQFEDKVAYLRALLIQETINRIEVPQTTKNIIKKEIIKNFSQL